VRKDRSMIRDEKEMGSAEVPDHPDAKK